MGGKGDKQRVGAHLKDGAGLDLVEQYHLPRTKTIDPNPTVCPIPHSNQNVRATRPSASTFERSCVRGCVRARVCTCTHP